MDDLSCNISEVMKLLSGEMTLEEVKTFFEIRDQKLKSMTPQNPVKIISFSDIIKKYNFFTDLEIVKGVIVHLDFRTQEINIRQRSKRKVQPTFCFEEILQTYEYYDQEEQLLNCKIDFTKQSDISLENYENLINWIIKINDREKSGFQVLFLCVQMINRYLNIIKVNKTELFMVGATCYFIADKFDNPDPFEIDEIAYLCKKNKKQIAEMEFLILKELNFNIYQPNVYMYLWGYSKVWHPTEIMIEHANNILVETLRHHNLNQYLPSMLAASIILLINKKLKFTIPWSTSLQYYTKYTYNDLKKCYHDLKLL